ncbi:MAG: DUF4231 domain-containing protein [Chloroflexota bacterium]
MAQSRQGVSSGFRRLLRLMAVPRPQVPKEYQRPANEIDYLVELDQQGFIVSEKMVYDTLAALRGEALRDRLEARYVEKYRSMPKKVHEALDAILGDLNTELKAVEDMSLEELEQLVTKKYEERHTTIPRRLNAVINEVVRELEDEQPQKMEQALHDALTSKYNIGDVSLQQFPSVIADLKILERYLMPVFWDFNQKASHFQSRYYYYQRIFLVAALLTTLISVLNSYIHGLPVDIVDGVKILGLKLPDATQLDLLGQLNFFLGVCTAIISARASYYTLLANYGEPRQRWAQYRRLTEELRIVYFKFLAHLGNYKGPNRVTALRNKVYELRKEETQDG